MITFSPNVWQMVITLAQLRAIMTIVDAAEVTGFEVVEEDNNDGAVKVYVGNAFEIGDSYHRYHIDREGSVYPPEYATVTNSDGTDLGWEWEW